MNVAGSRTIEDAEATASPGAVLVIPNLPRQLLLAGSIQKKLGRPTTSVDGWQRSFGPGKKHLTHSPSETINSKLCWHFAWVCGLQTSNEESSGDAGAPADATPPACLATSAARAFLRTFPVLLACTGANWVCGWDPVSRRLEGFRVPKGGRILWCDLLGRLL